MSYTATPTFVTGAVLTAAQLNILSTDMTDIDRRTSPVGATVPTLETTTSPTFAALATAGPAVTAIIGANRQAVVTLYCRQYSSLAAEATLMGFSISGATTLAASDGLSLTHTSPAPGSDARRSAAFLLTSAELAAAGSTSFTAVYRRTNGTGTFESRRISVQPLGA